MNSYLQQSIEFANQRNYLDELFKVYPTLPNGLRDIPQDKWVVIESAFEEQNNLALIRALLELPLFPIKDSYIAYLRRDPSAIERNPKTINRLAGRLYEMGLSQIWNHCSAPKESNTQIGPMFKNWLDRKSLGILPVGIDEFASTNDDAILKASDTKMMQFAQEKWGYQREKGLDFVARFNGKYVIAEAKFLTDFGGHQNAQLEDALQIFSINIPGVIPIAILDGVLYIDKGQGKMYRRITESYGEANIMSSLVLNEFLYSL